MEDNWYSSLSIKSLSLKIIYFGEKRRKKKRCSSSFVLCVRGKVSHLPSFSDPTLLALGWRSFSDPTLLALGWRSRSLPLWFPCLGFMWITIKGTLGLRCYGRLQIYFDGGIASRGKMFISWSPSFILSWFWISMVDSLVGSKI